MILRLILLCIKIHPNFTLFDSNLIFSRDVSTWISLLPDAIQVSSPVFLNSHRFSRDASTRSFFLFTFKDFPKFI